MLIIGPGHHVIMCIKFWFRQAGLGYVCIVSYKNGKMIAINNIITNAKIISTNKDFVHHARQIYLIKFQIKLWTQCGLALAKIHFFWSSEVTHNGMQVKDVQYQRTTKSKINIHVYRKIRVIILLHFMTFSKYFAKSILILEIFLR